MPLLNTRHPMCSPPNMSKRPYYSKIKYQLIFHILLFFTEKISYEYLQKKPSQESLALGNPWAFIQRASLWTISHRYR